MPTAEVNEPVKMERASPIVFTPKKDGTIHISVDYRMLDVMKIRNRY